MGCVKFFNTDRPVAVPLPMNLKNSKNPLNYFSLKVKAFNGNNVKNVIIKMYVLGHSTNLAFFR